MSVFTVILLFLAASQIYWLWRGYRLAGRLIGNPVLRAVVCIAIFTLYFLAIRANLPFSWHGPSPVEMTWKDALIGGPALTWMAASMVAFLVVIVFAIPQSAVGAARWIAAKQREHGDPDAPSSPERRVFLERTANAVAAGPFVAGAYGLFYGRLNLDTHPQTIRIPKLPRAFEGFRIAQLSDIHIGPFMPGSEIRRYVAIANAFKADMAVLTGDFVTFDPGTQQAAVESLAALRAPYGVYGCLGNHDAWSGVEASITALFRQVGVRILRGERVELRAGSDSINLIGVDFQSHRQFGPSRPVPNLLGNIAAFIDRDRVNILLSHNPDTFPRAAELGIDLSMAGHTHGGQAALEFISPEIAPSRLVTPYVAGLFQKNGSQLYVNRGIGTIGVPIRVGAPPEITVYQLTRG